LIEDVLVRHTFKARERVAQESTVAILNALNKNVSVVEHKVISAHALAGRGRQKLINHRVSVATVTEVALLCDVSDLLLNRKRASLTTLDTREVNLVIKRPEVNNGLDDT